MPLDPSIALLARDPGAQESFRSLGRTIERLGARAQQDRQFKEDLALRTKAQTDRTRLAEEESERRTVEADTATRLQEERNQIARDKLELDRAVKGHKLGTDVEKRRNESVATGAANLRRFWDDEGNLVDPEGAQAFLDRRRQSIDRHNELFPNDPIDSVQTDRALAQLEQDPQGLFGELERSIEFGQRIGLIEPTPEEQLRLQENSPMGRLTRQIAGERLETSRASRAATEEKTTAGQAKRRAEAGEAAAKSAKNKAFVNDALEIIKFLRSPAQEDALTAASGPVSSVLPTLRDSTANVEVKVATLQSILTKDNLDLLTGVLSDTDIELLRRIAAGGLDLRSEKGIIDELGRLEKKLTLAQNNLSGVILYDTDGNRIPEE